MTTDITKKRVGPVDLEFITIKYNKKTLIKIHLCFVKLFWLIISLESGRMDSFKGID